MHNPEEKKSSSSFRVSSIIYQKWVTYSNTVTSLSEASGEATMGSSLKARLVLLFSAIPYLLQPANLLKSFSGFVHLLFYFHQTALVLLCKLFLM